MLCPACSTDVSADSVFCPKCGHRLAYPAPGGSHAPAETPAERLRGDQRSANEQEQKLWQGSYSPKAMYGQWLLGAIATLVAIVLCVVLPTPITWMAAGVIVVVLWICLAGVYFYERLSIDYLLTTQRFVHQSGLLRRVINRVEVIDIDDVTVEQGFIERMFGVGTIKLLSSDTSDPKLLLRGIDDVKRVATMIDDARRDERRKRGMYIETV